jgi:hypothetical protein
VSRVQVEQLIIIPFLIVFSLGLLVTSLLSYRRTKNNKLVFISIVFIIFLLKGILMAVDLIYPTIIGLQYSFSFVLFDLGVLFFLFIATLKR